MSSIIKILKESAPLIHVITNDVSKNDCANITLAAGARPIMSEYPEETADITRSSEALAINVGCLTEEKIKSITTSMRTACECGVPICMDAVGVAGSSFRLDLVRELCRRFPPRILKGNQAEISALCGFVSPGAGVDSKNDKYFDINKMRVLARSSGCIVMATGKTDYLTDGERVTAIYNDCSMLPKVSGTGCMLNCLTAAFMTCEEPYYAAGLATAAMCICGEDALPAKGPASFKINLIDNIYNLNDKILNERIRTKEVYNEF